MLKNVPVCFLVSFGHCGIDYLHSLIDAHPQVLLMPAFSFYRSWKILNCNEINNPDEMFSVWRKYIEEDPSLQIIRRKFLYEEQESKKFFFKFRELLESWGINRRNVFYALHQAYCFAQEIDFSRIRIVIAQEHVPFHFEQIFTDFADARILQIIRDPRATMAGAFRQMTKSLGHLSDYYFNFITEYWMQGYQNWKDYNPKIETRYKVVRNEDLHASLESEMKGIARWIGIDYSPTLLKCTFSGRHWEGESAYMTADNKYPEPEEIFYLPENVKKRWMSELSYKEIVMIEFLTRSVMKEFGYECLTPDTIFQKVYGFILYLLPHRGLFKFWLDSYPKIREFDSVSRRLGNGILGSMWKLCPNPIKFMIIFSRSIMVRFRIHFFPGDRGQRYV